MSVSDVFKALLDNDPNVQAVGSGPWKRVSRRRVASGTERVFRNLAGTCFARTLESEDGVPLITHVAGSEKELEQATQVSQAPSAPSTVSTHRIEGTPHRVEAANRALNALLAREEVDEEDVNGAGMAYANRMLFGVSGFIDNGLTSWNPVATIEETAMKAVSVVIVPKGTDDFGDQPLFIDSLVPNPDKSESPNESSDWFIGGFTDVYEAVRAMLDAGFAWDEEVQAGVPAPADTNLVPWIRAGANLAERPSQSIRPPRL